MQLKRGHIGNDQPGTVWMAATGKSIAAHPCLSSCSPIEIAAELDQLLVILSYLHCVRHRRVTQTIGLASCTNALASRRRRAPTRLPAHRGAAPSGSQFG